MRLRHFLFVTALVLGASTLLPTPEANAQVESKTADESIKEQQAAKAAREKIIAVEQKAREDHHKKIQTKKTRRRMKKNRKKSQKLASGRSVPFYQRWFRKKGFK